MARPVRLDALLRRHGRLKAVPSSRLRLFVSFDIVGSTAHKQRAVKTNGNDLAHPWLKPFTEFFAKVEAHVIEEVRELSPRLPSSAPASLSDAVRDRQPQLWKAIGDEAVFVTEIHDLRAVPVFLFAFRRVLRWVREELSEVSLDAKSSVWLAGFPVTNSELVLGPRSDTLLDQLSPHTDWFLLHYARCHLHDIKPTPGERLDFIGPQMDLGFRLGALATPRRIVLAADAAWAVAFAALDGALGPDFAEATRLHFLGMQSLKGVLGGQPYPAFWLDAADPGAHAAHDRLTGEREVTASEVQEFFDEFVHENSRRFPWLAAPFVAGIPGQDAGRSEYHRRRVQELTTRWTQAVGRWQSSAAPPAPDAGSATRADDIRAFLERATDPSTATTERQRS